MGLRDRRRELVDPQPDEPHAPAGQDIRSVEARIARKLVRLVEMPEPGGGAQPPLPYLRRHLVEHAAAGEILDDRFLPPAFLPYLDPNRLRLVTSRAAGAGGLLGAWRHVAHGWDWDDPAFNADALRFRLATAGHAAGKSVWAPGSCWTPRWLRWSRDAAEILARHTGGIWCVATAVLPGGREIVVAGCDDGTIGRWDLRSGEQFGDPLTAHEDDVRAITTAVLPDGRTGGRGADRSRRRRCHRSAVR